MGLADTLLSKGTDLAGKAMQKLFEDQRRAQQVANLVGALQQGRKAIDAAQEQVLKNMGVASSGDMKAAGKRLAQLRKSARALDEKLGALQKKLGEDGR
jgi:hypothetical protein